MSKGKIPKEGTIRRGDTKIKGGTRGESQGEHGGAKKVPRGCQREGVHKRGMIRGSQGGQGGGSQEGQCQGHIFQQGDTKEGGTELY